ncbi:transcription factor TFIIIB component B'' homolog isoform 2-T2 [Leptodactylus fuscus]|uniref:transcription factor TFIIIB component B'' homolog isoform X2 n=1 Tax=Leptodactylus fuscus TaxID=238119 RepID=UPI003F4F2BD1
MIRRARLSFKPNVRPGGRSVIPGSASGGKDGGTAPPAESVPDPAKEQKTVGPGEGNTAPGTGDPVVLQPPEENKAEPTESVAIVRNETPPSRTTSTPLQRRKRISTLPNLAKPRVSNATSAVVPPPKPSQTDVPSVPSLNTALCKTDGQSPEKGKVPITQKPQVPLSPPQGQHVALPEKRTPVPQVPQFSPYKKSVLKPQEVSSTKPPECPLKERPSQKSCNNEIFELLKKSPSKKLITSNLEKERLRRAQKLRDLLRAELRKEKKAWRAQHPVISPMVEPEKSKMTMRDFVHFIPLNNPMSSSLEESKNCEKSSPPDSQVTSFGGKNSAEEDNLDDDEEEDDSQLLAPRVKVAEDGSIILDEESLTVEVSRTKAPIVEGNDPIFERGSTTTYSSFRRNTYSKPWSDQETDMFFLAISMVGTDFSMIGQLFPHRERIEIKNKFKKEERVNGWRIDKAFREKKDFDFEFFAKLLEKALEAGKKKKSKSKQPRKTNTKSRKKQKDKASVEQSLCDEESIISEEGVDSTTAEKENKRAVDVDECSGVTDSAPVKKKRNKRKKDNTKDTEEENPESQNDDVTQTQKKKSSKIKKTPALDPDIPELQSVDSDGSHKEVLAEKKTRVQKNKPNYKESEVEDDENDDYDMAEDIEVDDAPVSCTPGEADVSSQSLPPPCDEETSLVLFTEESDYQSGLDDLSSLHHSLSEVNEAMSQTSSAPLVAPNLMVGETEAMNVSQEESSLSACDKLDGSNTALDAESGEQDSEPKEKIKMPQGRRARPVPNLSRASVKQKVATEEQSEANHLASPSNDKVVGKSEKEITQDEGLSMEQQKQADKAAKADDSSAQENRQKESTIKPALLGRGRLLKPKPNLPGRTSTRREKLDGSGAKEGTEESADVLVQEKKEDPGNLKGEEIDISSMDDKKRQDSCFSAEVSSPVKRVVDSESGLSQTEELNTVQQDCDKTDTSKEKPSLPVRGRFRPKPNLTRAPAKTKSSGTEQESEHSQDSGQLKGEEIGMSSLDTKNKQDSCVPADVSSPVKRVVESESDLSQTKEQNTVQQDCDKADTSKEKPSLPVRGRFRPKPNLTRAPVKTKSSGSEQESERSQGSEQVSHVSNKPPSPTPDTGQEKETKESMESSSGSQDECGKPSIKPATLSRGRFQRPKPNLRNASSQKEASGVKQEPSAQSAGHDEGDSSKDLPTDSSAGKQENESLVNTVSGSFQDSCETGAKSSSLSSQLTQDSTVNQVDLIETSILSETETIKSPTKAAPLARGRFQKPKPNLVRASGRKGESEVKSSESFEVASGSTEKRSEIDDVNTSTVASIPEDAAETVPLLAKSDKENSFAEEEPVTLETSDNKASPETSVDSTPAMIDKEQSASEDEKRTLKPVFTRGRFQRPKPNLKQSSTRSVPALLVSTVQEENRSNTTDTDNNDPNISVHVEVFVQGDAEVKSSTEKEIQDKPILKELAQPEEAARNAEQGEIASSKSVRTRFPKPSPNLGRAAVRKETSTAEPKTLVPEKGQEMLKVNDQTPELSKLEDMPDISVTGRDSKEAEPAVEEKSAAIKPAPLRRGRLIRPVPNLVKQSAKTLRPVQSKTNEELNAAPPSKDEDPVVATSSPAIKRKATEFNDDLSPKRICPSGTPQKPSCLSDSEVDQPPVPSESPSSSQSSSVQDTTTAQRSRFGRPLKKLSTPPSASPKSENSSDRPEKEKPARSLKPSTTKTSKPVSSKSKGKTTLVKIRATQQEEDDEDDADLGFEDENYDLAPDVQNQAPVFVPFSLRSPKPVTAEIEETVEELELPVDVVDLQCSTDQDSETTSFQHVVDSHSQPDKKGEFLSPECTENHISSEEQLKSIKVLSSPSRDLLSSPHRLHSAPNIENPSQANVIGSAESLPNPVNENLAIPIEQISYPVMREDAVQQDFSSQDVTVSDCLLEENNTAEETTFILTLVEIPINEDYAYSCDSSMTESLPAPVLISSGSSQSLMQSLNPSTESASYESNGVDQDDADRTVEQKSRKRSAPSIDEDDQPPLKKQPIVSEETADVEIKATAAEADVNGNVSPKVSVTEPKPEEPSGVSQICAPAIMERPADWPTLKNGDTVPVEMPGMSTTDSLNRNLPLVYANPITTSKITLKRPGRKPLGFLSLVCKEKQSKKSNEESRKKKNQPKPKYRKIFPTIRGQRKESPDMNLESANDSEVPSSSPVLAPAEEMQSTTTEDSLPSTSQISDNQDTESLTSSKSPDLTTEEEAAPVSEYFFSDIFMEVDD